MWRCWRRTSKWALTAPFAPPLPPTAPPPSCCPSGPQSPEYAPPGYDLFRDHRVGSHSDKSGGLKGEWLSSGHAVGQSSGAYFLSQLQREETELEDVCDSMLLASDEQGRM